jgi:hypothetical protein
MTMRALLILITIFFSANALAQIAPPKVGGKPRTNCSYTHSTIPICNVARGLLSHRLKSVQYARWG